MSDARSLLRQQRAARRVTHPSAAYSDTGKLLCTLCREPIKSESLWEGHIAGEKHRKREAAAAATAAPSRKDTPPAATTNKRKHDSDDQDMTDDATEQQGDDDDDADSQDAHKRKRTRSDGPGTSSQTPPATTAANRRLSQTPSQGIELQIPSRPATPRDSANISSASSSTTATALPRHPAAADKKTGAAATPTTATAAPAASSGAPQNVDEDEWAAFEAEIAATENATYDAEATISGNAMTAEESARQREQGGADGDGLPKNHKPENDLQDEKEDAKLALEGELDEMRDLEAKVARLKEKRDALRKRATSHSQETGSEQKEAKGSVEAAAAAGEGTATGNDEAVDDEEEDESDDDDDDWDGFRFRAAAR